jgi:Na+/melibiose symporter-like transporter
LIFAIIQGPQDGWTSGRVLAAFIVAGIAGAAFVVWERRSDHPMLPMSLFRDYRFSTGAGVTAAAFFVMFGFFFLATQYFQLARGYSPLEAGLATLPAAVTLIAISPRSAALVERFGAARVMALGLAIIAGGLGVMATVTPHSAYPVFAVAVALLGAGVAITVAPATGLIMTSVPLSKAGVGSAVNDTSRELGGALGIAILGSIANTAYRSRIDLSGLRLPPGVRPAAESSIGAADAIARHIPGGDALATQAASAFTDAFNLVAVLSVGIALAAAAVILFVWRRRPAPATENVEPANGDVEPTAADVGVLARVPVRPCP